MIYNDIKYYIQDKYQDMMANAIQRYINSHKPFDVSEVGKVKNVAVTGLVWKRIKLPKQTNNFITSPIYSRKVHLHVLTSVTIETSCDESKKPKFIERLFQIRMSAILNCGLHNVTIDKIIENTSGGFRPTTVFEEYFLPYISPDKLEKYANRFTEKYCKDAKYNKYDLPIEHIMRKMGVYVTRAKLPDNSFGRIYFRESIATYGSSSPECADIHNEKRIAPGTIFVTSNEHYFMDNYGSFFHTVAHEFVHWDKHKDFFEVLFLLNDSTEQLSCSIDPQIPNSTMSSVQQAMCWAEWQANALATRITMPEEYFFKALYECYDEALQTPIKGSKGIHLERALELTAQLFSVSAYDAKSRAIQLGITEADGVLLSEGMQYYEPISYNRYSLNENQTYVLSDKDFNDLVNSDDSFAELIRQGLFVRVECFVALNSNIYIDSDGDKLTLSSYARNHADECCLKFERHYNTVNGFDYGYYGQCYLSKNLTEDCPEDIPADILTPYNVYYKNIHKNKALTEQSQIYKAFREEGVDLMKYYKSLPDSSGKTLKLHMKTGFFDSPYDEDGKLIKKKKKDSPMITIEELNHRSHVPEKTIGKIRNNKYHSRNPGIICAICIGLHLPPLFSRDLVKKLIVDFPATPDEYIQLRILEEYFHYDLAEVNEILVNCDLSPWPDEEKANDY